MCTFLFLIPIIDRKKRLYMDETIIKRLFGCQVLQFSKDIVPDFDDTAQEHITAEIQSISFQEDSRMALYYK